LTTPQMRETKRIEYGQHGLRRSSLISRELSQWSGTRRRVARGRTFAAHAPEPFVRRKRANFVQQKRPTLRTTAGKIRHDD
jgi:hypothetical protein